DHTHAHGREGPGERVVLEVTALAQPLHRVGQGHVGTGDRSGTRTTVGLQDIAVQGDRVFAHRLEVDDGTQGAADEARDLVGTAADLAAYRLTGTAGVGGARE